MQIVTIDFEASCLPVHGRSFPIEVGIATNGWAARSWLIRPHQDWIGWSWTEEAEAMHGISHDRLLVEGLPVERVVAELREVLRGARVFADSYLDAEWMKTLAAAARTPVPASVGHIEEILVALGASARDVAEADAALETLAFGRHRAGEDARRLYALIEELRCRAGATVSGLARPLFHWPSSEQPIGMPPAMASVSLPVSHSF
ncbi:3'-5' exonuclease family protein [Flavisphingomonas formosensis]|uniref:hypothetical protein n=1 Tax=Flavisphingomonas formosensis TaxID=861534 RepID=UPI0018DFEECF|nr:hypothetical protein [Sphingomonas formosensis]